MLEDCAWRALDMELEKAVAVWKSDDHESTHEVIESRISVVAAGK
jgi:hypothetical protein